MSNNDCGDFSCDALWMTRLAREGELIRVPEALYRKRYTGRSAHTEWLNWPMEQKIAAWVGHCLDMLAEALTVAQGAGERRRLIEAARRRLLLREKKLAPTPSSSGQCGCRNAGACRLISRQGPRHGPTLVRSVSPRRTSSSDWRDASGKREPTALQPAANLTEGPSDIRNRSSRPWTMPGR